MHRIVVILSFVLAHHAAPQVFAQYEALVTADKPVTYWRFEEQKGTTLASLSAEAKLAGQTVGQVDLRAAGPRPQRFGDFTAANSAIALSGRGGYVKVADPGKGSPLDFDRGDAITLEAWVNLRRIDRGQQMYVIGKGRTNRRGFARENQNYSLRLRDVDGSGARISFLFRDADNRPAGHAEFAKDWHRWTSKAGFWAGSGWHHIAVTYTFGRGDSLKGYIDGQPVAGTWDMGGKSDERPVVDDDEMWIGTSLGGNARCTFDGQIDEVAIYRTALSRERIAKHYRAKPAKVAPLVEPKPGEIVAEIFEGVPDTRTWSFQPPPTRQLFTHTTFAFIGVPKKYSPQAIVVDRTPVFLLRATGDVTLAAGEHRFLLRSKGAARLFIDDKLVMQTSFPPVRSSGHESVPDPPKVIDPRLRILPVGHREQVKSLKLDGKPHRFRLECLVGGSNRRAEVGELSLSVSTGDGPFRLLSATPDAIPGVTHDDEHWYEFAKAQRLRLEKLDAETRRRAGTEEAKYWAKRHAAARKIAANPGGAARNVDQLIQRRLEDAGLKPAPLADDLSFLRRVYLDTVGVIPTPAEIREFLADKPEERRSRVVERLLNDSRWADHWVPYWQDVLAENPGILKPKLNNTGPFRWWIYESFLDNKPMDRFVTELVMMQGSKYGGGPAGFALATQNDVPMAAKAHVLAKAFLGVELRCARCHDAPYHPYLQRDTFSLAAMLGRSTVKVPSTSSVDLTKITRQPLVEVTLKPGAAVVPAWPFKEIASAELPDGVLRNPRDPRERLAALLTSPHNERFAAVMVNRLWARYLGRGLVEPVDDWLDAEPSHPELLKYLAGEFVTHGYDVKHVARLILNSQTYQRAMVASPDAQSEAALSRQRLFATPTRRRLTAEQIVDSLFVAVGKEIECEELTLDPDNRRPQKDFLNLGVPRRAWEFAPLSNERDRPALSLPAAQSVVDVLATFGWRASRQHPTTEREETPTVLQPLVLANGIVGRRITRLSDDSAVTELCLQDKPLGGVVEEVYLHVLGRRPRAEEAEMFSGLLSDGYTNRRVPGAKKHSRVRRGTSVSWSNHLSPEATRIKLALEKAAREGDPPTARLRADWRERMEDMLWSLVNSPEFLFVP